MRIQNNKNPYLGLQSCKVTLEDTLTFSYKTKHRITISDPTFMLPGIWVGGSTSWNQDCWEKHQ